MGGVGFRLTNSVYNNIYIFGMRLILVLSDNNLFQLFITALKVLRFKLFTFTCYLQQGDKNNAKKVKYKCLMVNANNK